MKQFALFLACFGMAALASAQALPSEPVTIADGRVVIGGDMAVWFGELDEPSTEGQLLVRALDPELVWLAHEHEPWRPRTA